MPGDTRHFIVTLDCDGDKMFGEISDEFFSKHVSELQRLYATTKRVQPVRFENITDELFGTGDTEFMLNVDYGIGCIP